MNKIITIGRELGSGGRTIGKEVARRLGIEYYDRQIIDDATRMPSSPAASPTMRVSALNTRDTSRLDAPTARSMPISLVRSSTEMLVMMPIMMEDTTSEMDTKAMSR